MISRSPSTLRGLIPPDAVKLRTAVEPPLARLSATSSEGDEAGDRITRDGALPYAALSPSERRDRDRDLAAIWRYCRAEPDHRQRQSARRFYDRLDGEGRSLQGATKADVEAFADAEASSEEPRARRESLDAAQTLLREAQGSPTGRRLGRLFTFRRRKPRDADVGTPASASPEGRSPRDSRAASSVASSPMTATFSLE